MGNAQSSPGGHRISKPKGVGNARLSKSLSPASLPEELKASSNTSEHSSRESPSTIALPTSDCTADGEFRHQLLLQSLSPEDSVLQLQKQNNMDSLAASVVRSLSRRNSKATQTVSARSSVAQIQNGSRLSVATEKGVDLQSAIAILQELRKTASPEDMAALHKALLPVASRDSLAPSSTSEPPEDLDPATAALIRRKSFAQPGVFTRFAKADNAVLRKSVPAPSSRLKQPWTKDMMVISPLARLSSLDKMEPPSDILENRAQTPSELDYSQLGNLKHGSLQVVNGCPSPVPSMASPGMTDRKVSNRQDENYFTASKRGDDNRPSSKRDQTLVLSQNQWNALNATEAQPPGRGKVLDYSPQRRESTPLNQEVHLGSLDAAHDSDAESVYSRHVKSARSMVSLHSQSSRRFSFEEENVDDARPAIAKRLPEASQSAISLASDYMAEMPPSPFTKGPEQPLEAPVSPPAQDFFKSPVSGVREQVVGMPAGATQDFAPISPRKPLRSHPAPDGPLIGLPILPKKKPKRPVGVKVDSGYSSNASARNSITENVSPLEIQQANLSTVESLTTTPPKQLQRFYGLKNPVDLSIRIGQIGGKRDETPGTEAGADDDIIESIERDPAPQEKMNRGKSWRKSVRRSLPRLMSSESAASVFSKSTSAISDSTMSNSEHKPKKLQKRRPLSQPPINLSDRHILESGIPRVPSTVFSRYSSRLSASPGMQHLEQTFDNGTISCESFFDPAAAGKSFLPSYFFPDVDEDPAPPAHRRMSFGRKSFRRSRSKSQVDEHEVPSNGIADFGTVGQSLGTSPYDAAMPPMPRRPSSGAPTQPNHLSTMAPKPGLREGWDAETASKFAQTRSRERASQMYAWEQQRNAEKRPMPARPVSYHEHMPMHAYRPPPRETSVPRPKSMHGNDVPRPKSMHASDVPSIPYSQSTDREHLRQDAGRIEARPKTPHAQSRDPSPVKKLVSAFEQKASEGGTAPLPVPTSSVAQQPDWTDSSRIWRERRVNAAQTASPPPANQRKPPLSHIHSSSQSMSVTTTTVTALGTRATGGAQRPTPPVLNKKSMPQMRQVPGSTSHTTTTTTMSTMYGSGGGNTQSYNNGYGTNREGLGTSTTTTTRRLYGIDFGDVPVRVI